MARGGAAAEVEEIEQQSGDDEKGPLPAIFRERSGSTNLRLRLLLLLARRRSSSRMAVVVSTLAAPLHPPPPTPSLLHHHRSRRSSAVWLTSSRISPPSR